MAEEQLATRQAQTDASVARVTTANEQKNKSHVTQCDSRSKGGTVADE